MIRAPHTLPRLSALAVCLAGALLLPACSSGGGSRGDSLTLTPRPPPPPSSPPPPFSPPPPSPPPPAPPPRSSVLPAAPASKPAPGAPDYNIGAIDLIKLIPTGTEEALGSVSTAGRLTKQGGGSLFLPSLVRFDGGTALQEGSLTLVSGELFSNVSIAPGATFELVGDVVGDVFNNGVLAPTQTASNWDYGNFYEADVFGNYTQGPDGVLRLSFGVEGLQAALPLLTVTGTATLDGRVEFARSDYVPSGGYLEWLIHSYAGVVGQFDGWSTLGALFLSGDLHYTPNDVYFLSTQVSTQATMTAAKVGDALTLAAASRVDDAFGVGDSLAAQPELALTGTQRQFLRSAAAIQRLQDFDQAAATFDSLSGHGHADAAQSLLQQAMEEGPQAATHAAALPSGVGGAWAESTGLRASAGGATAVQAGGYDRWLSDRLLLGSRVGWTRADLRFDRSGGSVRDESPTWSLFLRRTGTDGSYLVGDLGFSRHQLSLDRFIDLGAGRRPAISQLDLQATHAYVEAGREFAIAGGRLSPYAALNYATLRGAGFAEAGTTGFELQVQASFHQRLSSDAGVRYARDWRWGSGRWLQLSLDARYRHLLSATDRMRAAFTGTPETQFELTGLADADDGVGLGANLLGGGDRWGWLLRYDRRAEDQAVSMRLQRDFR